MVGAKEYPKKKEACRSLTHQGNVEWFGGVTRNEVGWEKIMKTLEDYANNLNHAQNKLFLYFCNTVITIYPDDKREKSETHFCFYPKLAIYSLPNSIKDSIFNRISRLTFPQSSSIRSLFKILSSPPIN